MTKQDAAQAEDQGPGPASEDTDDRARDEKSSDGTLSEKPEPDEDAKEKAAEMMKSYEDRPTLVVPGSGGAISGTAVNDWLDDEGNPKFADDKDSPANKVENDSGDNGDTGDAKPRDDDSEDHTKKARNVTGEDSTTASEGDKTRGEAAEEREREKQSKSMEEQIEEDKAFNKKVIEESEYTPQKSDQESKESKQAAS
ncbi:hypothetical protein BST27_15405 [Mycobacterium intermedium]|uniref:Uncharacterized protein n=1 Tax=Mycobacterium intermedium TaxID=28445 RepID=A0A1E3S8Q0_MYCIE|nr:hypothetical protein [Mycobacterium intermedium]ODQ98519.1 hypothetical protein BHQ20_21750 [Mycobacterium intermedium]OPE47489.1 hypothetical protein BV508_21870 [Mycobacterium intermedium]ORB03529.1 hypothetical protein BST27_15405 [Mycobacterium intermedium]